MAKNDKSRRTLEDGSEKDPIERKERAAGPLTQEGPAVDLEKFPCTEEAWTYLRNKVEDLRSTLRFFIRREDLEFLALSVAKRQLTLDEVKVLVREDTKLTCGAPTGPGKDHETPHEFTGVAVMVISDKEQKDAEGNYFPTIEGLSDELSRYIARHPDGGVKQHGSVFLHPRMEMRGEGARARLTFSGFVKVAMCGSRFYIGHDEKGRETETISQNSHFGKFFHLSLQRERDRARSQGKDTRFARVYTHTDSGADATIAFLKNRAQENRAKRLEQKDEWNDTFGFDAPTAQTFTPRRRRGDGQGTHGGRIERRFN